MEEFGSEGVEVDGCTHRILFLYHHLPILDTAHTTPLVCLLAVLVRLLGPLQGPKLLLLLPIDFSPLYLTPLSK